MARKLTLTRRQSRLEKLEAKAPPQAKAPPGPKPKPEQKAPLLLRDAFMDRMFIIGVSLLILFVVGVIVVIGVVWWSYLSRATRPFVQGWAMLTTLLLLPFAAIGAVIGFRLAENRYLYMAEGWQQAMTSGLDKAQDAGVKSADVRFYAGSRWVSKREPTNSQEIYLDENGQVPWLDAIADNGGDDLVEEA